MAKVLNQIFSKKIIAKLGYTILYYTSMLDYHLVFCETKEPPSAEQYARQCKRSANQLMISLLVLYFQYENNYDTYYH